MIYVSRILLIMTSRVQENEHQPGFLVPWRSAHHIGSTHTRSATKGKAHHAKSRGTARSNVRDVENPLGP